MILGKVLDNIVATQKHAALSGQPLFWVQPLTGDGQPSGDAFVALDSVSSGPGDTVIVCNEGTGCRQILDAGVIPVNHVIAGFVDRIERV